MEPETTSARSEHRDNRTPTVSPSSACRKLVSPTSLLAMKKTRASHLIHGIVETGEIRRSDRSEWSVVRMAPLHEALERSLNRRRHGGAVSLEGNRSIVTQASLPGRRLSVRFYPLGMFPGGACASP